MLHATAVADRKVKPGHGGHGAKGSEPVRTVDRRHYRSWPATPALHPNQLTGLQSMYGNQAILRSLSGRGLQRKSCCDDGAPCAECARKQGHEPGSSGAAAALENLAPPLVHTVLASPGTPLSSEGLSFMEPRFGYDFGGVRVHTDSQAALSAQMVNAHAYTVGRDIVFGNGQYAPQTPQGRRLLAHELTHVVQQDSGPQRSPEQLMIGSGGSELERVADSIAASISDSPGMQTGMSIRSDEVAAVQREGDDASMTQDAAYGTSQGGGGAGAGQGEQAGDCSGWESDPQSFSKRAAEFYIRNLGVPSFEVTSIDCSGGPNWVCNATVNVRAGTLVVNVTLAPPFVRVESKPHMVCAYSYRCLPTGELILNDRGGGCPTF